VVLRRLHARFVRWRDCGAHVDPFRTRRVDTYSETKANRVIVWQTLPLAAGTHTIEVINLATEGRRRIDVDAFLMAL